MTPATGEPDHEARNQRDQARRGNRWFLMAVLVAAVLVGAYGLRLLLRSHPNASAGAVFLSVAIGAAGWGISQARQRR